MNHSPWLAQLKNNRSIVALDRNIDTEIAVIGGGIAGISTAFFVLKHTNFKVTLVEGFKIAHGATGHNAGQVVSYFEKPFTQLAQEYGLDLATKAQEEISQAWDLLEEMYTDTGLQTPLSQFTGYAGCISFDQLLVHLQNKHMRHKAGFGTDRALIADDFEIIKELPPAYKKVYTLVPRPYIHTLLETTDERYIAALPSRKGCLNSALFCEELVAVLLRKYPGRCTVLEHTPVQRVVGSKDDVVLEGEKYTVRARKAIVCTNGFENIELVNTDGPDIDTAFHENVYGIVGYMAGYLEESERQPTAISYFPVTSSKFGDPYFYLTRRQYEFEASSNYKLICIGGPETELPEKLRYDRAQAYPREAFEAIDTFLRSSYRYPSAQEYMFQWHGLMGYTKSGVRLIGPEPRNKNILYNLGCNGIGILPSIYGGKRISMFLKKGKLTPSIFDPR